MEDKKIRRNKTDYIDITDTLIAGVNTECADESEYRSLAEKNRMYDLVLYAIVIMMLTFILFEGDIFFCTTVMSFAFWLLTGMLNTALP